MTLYVCHATEDKASSLRLGFALERVASRRQPGVLPPAGRGRRRTHRARSACANAAPRAPGPARGASRNSARRQKRRFQVCAWGWPLNGSPRGALPQAPNVLPRQVAVGREGGRQGAGLAPPRHAPRGKRWALRLARPVHRLRGDAKTTPVACLGHGLRCRRRGNNARGGANGDRLRTECRLDARVWGTIYICIIPNGALRGMRILLWPHSSAIVGSLSVYGQAR